jgi:signal transduction histidine kinase
MSAQRLLAALDVAALSLVVTLGLARIGVGGGSSSPEAMLPFLLSAAALCVVGLAARRHPTTAWLALIFALAATTIDLASFGREQRAVIGPDAWRWLSITIVLSAIATVAAAAAYASDRGRRLGRWVPAFGGVAVAVVFLVGVWALATPDSETVADPARPLGDLGLVTRAFLMATVGLTIVGLLGDVRPAADRATKRLAVEGEVHAAPGDTLRYGVGWLRILVDELTPGRANERRAAMTERARIARDLHAVVVPDLRRAIREAERAGSVDRLASSLRDALRQVEAMIETRDAIGLEIGGLVPALESLAERIEDRSDVRITIDVADASDGAAGPPPTVAAAALRIATLALENVTRHAPAAAVRLDVAVGPDRVRLTIEDDGPGVSEAVDDGVSMNGHRGLIDMATEAELCGARLRTGRGSGGTGTVVAFDWPST